MADPVWVDGATPLNSTNMTKLQTRDEKNAPSGYVGLNASSQIVFQGDAVANLYRSAAGTLKTDGYLSAAQNIVAHVGAADQVFIGSLSSIPQIVFGSAADTNLYRSAVGVLRTDGQIYAVGNLCAKQGLAAQVYLGDRGPAGEAGISLGSAGDANIYRVGTGQLRAYNDFCTLGTGYIGNVDANSPCWNMRGTGIIGFLYQNTAQWGTVYAAGFANQSDRDTKTDIVEVADRRERWHAALMAAKLYEFRRFDEEKLHIGLMADELPDEVVLREKASPIEEMDPRGRRTWRPEVIGVDIYKLCTALLGSVQLLEQRLARLEE